MNGALDVSVVFRSGPPAGRLNANGSQMRLPFGKGIRLSAEFATCDPDESYQAGSEERK
jgi:hypothetical protein